MRNNTIRIHTKNESPQTYLNVNPNIFSMDNKTDIIFNIESLCVPKTYYNVYESQTIEFEDSAAVLHTLTFQPGNYDLFDFFDDLVQKMTTLDGILTYTWALQPFNQKIVIEADLPGVWILTFKTHLLAKYSGAVVDKNYIQSIQVIEFDYIANFERTLNFLISSNLRAINQTSYDNIQTSELTSKNNIIGVFPCEFIINPNAVLSTHQVYYGEYSCFTVSGPNFSTPLLFELRDDDFELIDLNGQYWTLDLFLRVNMTRDNECRF
jgi:hypothetical protein